MRAGSHLNSALLSENFSVGGVELFCMRVDLGVFVRVYQPSLSAVAISGRVAFMVAAFCNAVAHPAL
jgi:hypothetical protein